MPFELTSEQKAAVAAQGNVLVSAAAGSGKTAVLVERVISRLTDEKSPISADRLLIVTFTNAAAAEMRTRIQKRLDEECRKNPENLGLLKQKHLLDSAKICTIDSFCIDLARENFDKLGISQNFKISDGISLKSVDEGVLYNLIGEYLESGDIAFTQLLDIIGAEYDEGNFSEFVLRLYNYSRQLPFPKVWFEFIENTYKNGSFEKDSAFYSYAFERALQAVSDMKNQLASAVDLIFTVEKAAEMYLDTFNAAAKEIDKLYNAVCSKEWDNVYNCLQKFILPTLPTVRGISGYFEINAAKEIYKDSITRLLETINRLFYADFEFINLQYKFLSRPICLLCEILQKLETRLFEEYNLRNTFTFHNAEHMALQLLYDQNGDIKPTAEEFFDRFDEVMVDEYQDTNDLQDKLFYAISNRCKNLFVVGDVKQSIYAFRGANPINFLNKKNTYIELSNAENFQPKKVILANNFRTKAEVCDFINFFFESFMTEKTGKLVYNKEDLLIPRAVFPETDDTAVSLSLIDGVTSSENALDSEACVIAEYINEIISKKQAIRLNDNTLRPANYGDFAILLRNTKDKAPALATRLRSLGIPVNYSSEGYAESIEISTFLALLKVIDNPKNDVELLTVLMSPLFAFSPDELAMLRVNKRDGDLYSAVIFAKQQGNVKAEAFLKAMENYRLLSITLPLDKLISRLLNITEYLNMVSSMKDGTRRKNNLLMLCDYAVQYTESNRSSIDGFVKFVLKNSAASMKSATINTGSSSVRIMSIHASKGLQFPVCIVAAASNSFNESDARAGAIFSSHLGLGLKYFDEPLKKRITTVGREAIADSLQRSTFEEELRLLYVAMTRTQDNLLFVGSFKNLEKSIQKLKTHLIAASSEITQQLLSSTHSYADWLLLCALIHPDGKLLRSNQGSVMVKPTESQIKINVINAQNITLPVISDSKAVYTQDQDIVNALCNNIAYDYPFKPLLEIQSKSSVSAIANKAESAKFAFSGLPAFASKDGVTAAAKGTATHRVMEFFDFSKADNVAAELDRLAEWQYITETEREAVNVEQITDFFKSNLFARISKSPCVKREMRFLTEIDACEINPQLDKRFENEKIMVQGAVDVCFEEDGEIVVLDFKTDRTDNPLALAEAYCEQLSIYALACEKIFAKPVKEKIIYSFALSREISL